MIQILGLTITTAKGLEAVKEEIRKEYRAFTNKQMSDLMFENAKLKDTIQRLRGH